MDLRLAGPAPGEAGATISCDLDSIPLADIRAKVRDLLNVESDGIVENAVQVTDELASNAYQHGRLPRTCRLTVLTRPHRLRIEVDDASPAEPSMHNQGRTAGLGLVVVERLAISWGVSRHHGYKTVWAELALDRLDPRGKR